MMSEKPLDPDLVQPLANTEPPIDPLSDTAETRAITAPPGSRWSRSLIMLGVLGGTLCLCVLLVSFAGFAGYRDGLATNNVRVTQTLATGIAEQYVAGVTDLHQGYAELAGLRFAWIVETIQAPTQYALDSRAHLSVARTIAAYTPTSPPTITAPSPNPTMTLSPTLPPTEPATATLNPMTDPAYLYEQAATEMRLARYEEAIEWLDALRTLAPDYRALETQAMLIDALSDQGRIYLRGLNEDGADMLARGVFLIYSADELGNVNPSTLMGEAIFAELYINARNYVNGGHYAAAIPILEELCSLNCGWGYPSVNPVIVRDLLDQARAEAGNTP